MRSKWRMIGLSIERLSFPIRRFEGQGAKVAAHYVRIRFVREVAEDDGPDSSGGEHAGSSDGASTAWI